MTHLIRIVDPHAPMHPERGRTIGEMTLGTGMFLETLAVFKAVDTLSPHFKVTIYEIPAGQIAGPMVDRTDYFRKLVGQAAQMFAPVGGE